MASVNLANEYCQNVFATSVVTLELRNDSHDFKSQQPGIAGASLAIDAWTMTTEEWAEITDYACVSGNIHLRAQRAVLARQSTYFRALFGNFRESISEHVTVQWDVAIVCLLLQLLYSGQLHVKPNTFAPLLEGATFFGVEVAVGALESWISAAKISRDMDSVQDLLQNLSAIWNSAISVGNSIIPNICAEFLAINFAVVMLMDSFLWLPATLLDACISHPLLTVSSEKQLCEGVLTWYDNQPWDSEPKSKQWEPSSLFSKVRMGLLPLDFLLGKHFLLGLCAGMGLLNKF